ncbi:Ribose methyltransferase [Cichlidogyrus casuarinus]|uniref:Ribose methyltransferase n=1 Tax=Cichlidogyrus casuarinus TaxID=1844966 RepID=A0ABD2Q8K6_9PLAT
MNLGSILRTASFFGLSNIIVPSYNFAPLSPLISKLSAGSMEQINFYKTSDIIELMKSFRRHSNHHVVATSGVRACNSVQSTANRKLIIAIGSEDLGLSREFLSIADSVYRIPGFMDNISPATHLDELYWDAQHTSSLNVAVATGIAFYNILNLNKTLSEVA